MQFSLTCGFMLLLIGCSKDLGVPLAFHLSDQDRISAVANPTNTAALVVTHVEMVAAEPVQRRVTIKLLAQDASAFEKLTADNFGKTVIVVQGTNVLATPRITQPIPARAGIMLPISANVDFERTYRELLKLSTQ